MLFSCVVIVVAAAVAAAAVAVAILVAPFCLRAFVFVCLFQSKQPYPTKQTTHPTTPTTTGPVYSELPLVFLPRQSIQCRVFLLESRDVSSSIEALGPDEHHNFCFTQHGWYVVASSAAISHLHTKHEQRPRPPCSARWSYLCLSQPPR